MKTAWFYALRELRRRFLHFAGIFFTIGTAVFIPVTLYGILETYRGNGMNGQFWFFFAVIGAVLFGMVTMALADMYDKFADDYRLLLRYGLKRGILGVIQAIETTFLFILAALLFYPLSIGAVRLVVFRYNASLAECAWLQEERFAAYSLPERLDMPLYGGRMLVFMFILYAVILAAAVLAYHRGKRLAALSADIHTKNGKLPGEKKLNQRLDQRLDQRRNFGTYSAVTAKRMRRKLKHAGRTMLLSYLVPVVLLCAAMSFSEMQLISDVTIKTEDLRHPISVSAAEQLRTMDGVLDVRVYSYEELWGKKLEEPAISFIQIDLEEENWYDTADKIVRHPAFAEWNVDTPCYSEFSNNLRQSMLREYFCLAALLSFFSALITTGFLLNDCLTWRAEEMRILRRLGMNVAERRKLRISGGTLFCLPSVLFAGGIGVILYIGMSVYGGDRLGWDTLGLAVSVFVCLTALTVLLAAALAVHKERIEKNENRL